MSRVFTIPNDSKKEYNRLIGFYASDEMDAFVTLIGLNRTISRSFLLRSIVSDWLKKRHLNKDKIFKAVVEKIYLEYQMNHRKVGEEDKSLEEFKKGIRVDLLSRNLPEDFVSEILNLFDVYEKGK